VYFFLKIKNNKEFSEKFTDADIRFSYDIKKELANRFFNYIISPDYITIEEFFKKLLKPENIIVCCIKRQIDYYKRKYEIYCIHIPVFCKLVEIAFF